MSLRRLASATWLACAFAACTPMAGGGGGYVLCPGPDGGAVACDPDVRTTSDAGSTAQGDATGDGKGDTAKSDAGSQPDAGPDGGPVAGQPDVGTPIGPGVPGEASRSAAEVCQRYQADVANLAEGKWNGSKATCKAGDLDAAGRARTLKNINLVRYLADLPEVTHATDLDAKAQACALLMAANGKLSHSPGNDWKCFSDDGATAAKKSNLSTTPSVQAVMDYMIDAGASNAPTLGHRRWLLSNSLGPVGIGSTSGPSCLWVIGGTGKANKQWQAWPPPGPFPMAAYATKWASPDTTGWSLQSDTIAFDGALVTVRADGVDLPVKTTVLKPYYGSNHALSFIPQGWKAKAGTTYEVEVLGIKKPIAYAVQFVECGK